MRSSVLVTERAGIAQVALCGRAKRLDPRGREEPAQHGGTVLSERSEEGCGERCLSVDTRQ